jgi:DNA (cytosine-5)-methyltransferase 1
MIENVEGFLDSNFDGYRGDITAQLEALGYVTRFDLLNAKNFGLPQNRSRVFLVALQSHCAPFFEIPAGRPLRKSVGSLLFDLMQERGWKAAEAWRKRAKGVSPTIIGGSKKHLGLDLGPSRTKPAWAALGINSFGIAPKAPESDFEGLPKLTMRMAARLQGFPNDWEFAGNKRARYRQIGNALPPVMAFEMGRAIYAALQGLNSTSTVKLDPTNAERQRRFRERRRLELVALRNGFSIESVT